MISLDTALEADLTCGRYALIGAGQLGAMSLAMWPSQLATPEFILDSAKTGELEGIPILPLAGHVRDPSITYLLSAFKMPSAEIRRIFAGIGQERIITVYDFFDHFSPALFSNGWRNLTPSNAVRARTSAQADHFVDDRSRHVCHAVNAWRYDRELVADYPVGLEDEKYDLSLFGRAGHHYDVVCDGGAYDLHLLDFLAKANITWDRTLAFEPDPHSAEICRNRMAAWHSRSASPIRLDQSALSDHNGQQRFIANGLLSSRLTDGGNGMTGLIDVETIRLDDAILREAPDARHILIKLHVEGSETAALIGAEQLLRTRAVDVFVNLSHDERSWLAIPQFLASIDRHDLFLRSHALFGEGVTLFARYRD